MKLSYDEQLKYKFWIIFGLITIIFTMTMYFIYMNKDATYRNVKKSVVIGNHNLLEHELKTNDGFKVVLTGKCYSINPIINNEYFKSNIQLLYLNKITEEYTEHSSTDSKGRTTITYSWDYYDEDIQQVNNLNILDHNFKDVNLDFCDKYTVDLDEAVNDKYKSKTSENYIYLNGKWFSSVGDKRIYFKGLYNNNKVSLCGELSENTIKQYKGCNNVLLYTKDKDGITSSLKHIGLVCITIYIIGMILIIGYGIYYYQFKL